MAKFFSVDSLEPLEYDFTGIPKDGGKGYCKGKGAIPEPSTKALEEYQAAMQELMRGRSLEALQKQDTEENKKLLHQTLELTTKLCQNSPSIEELEELPPRYKVGYMKAFNREMSNPEVLTPGIRV